MATRLEKVILDLEDRFTGPMARATAATAALSKELHGLDGETVRVDKSTKALGDPNGSVAKTGAQSKRTSADIDRFSGRLRLLADTAAILGPALVPIGAVGIPAVAGLATALGTAALAGGTMVVAFQGVGTALEAVNKAQLEPTAENLEAARIAMQGLVPEARSFVRELQDARPALDGLRNAAAAGMFPGLEQGLNDLLTLGPEAEQILFRIGQTVGELGADAAESLSGPEWQDFFDYLGNQVPSLMDRFGRATGTVVHGLGELFLAFDPLNQGFANTLLDASRAFDEWASGLSDTQGFQEFIDYIRENGPRVADALAALGSALLDIIEAAAPLGGPTLEALTAFAKILSAIMDSPAGPTLVAVASGLALVNRAMRTFEAIKAAPLVASLGASADGATGKMTGLQKATLGVSGAIAGLTLGAQAIRAIQNATDEALPGVEALTNQLLTGTISGELNSIDDSIQRMTDPDTSQRFADFMQTPFEGLFGEAGSLRVAREEVEQLDAAFANIVQSAGPERAAEALQQFADSQGLSVDETEALIDQMPQYQEALAAVGNAAIVAGKKVEDGFTRARIAAQLFREGVTDLNRVLEKRSSMRDYEAALDDFSKGLEENGHNFDINTEKGRENQANLDEISSTIGRLAEKLHGTERQKFMEQAREDLKDMRDKGELTENQLDRLLKRIHKLDTTEAAAKIKVDVTDALRQIERVADALNIFDGTVGKRNDGTGFVDPGVRTKGPRGYASGGYTGAGAKYEPAGVVHRGEYVFSSEATRGNLAMLDGLHKQLKGYAGGGYVTPAQERSSVAASGTDYDRLARALAPALARMQPLYRDVYMQPHDYNEFARQMSRDRQAAAMGGFGA